MHNFKSLGYFIFVCEGCICNEIDNPVCCCLPCHKDAVEHHDKESYNIDKRQTRNNKRRCTRQDDTNANQRKYSQR